MGNPVVAMVGLHFTLGGLLAADLASTWAFQGLSRTQIVVLAAAALWLTACAGIFVRIARGSRLPSKFEDALVCLTSGVVAFAVLEVGVRLVVPDAADYLRPPNTHFTTKLDGPDAPGIQGAASFTTNEWGFRGPSVKLMSNEPNVVRIVAVGGSTTVSEFLDDSEEWPHLVMQDLNRHQHEKFVYVANAGMNGHNTADHLRLLDRFPVAKNADILVFLIGINDFMPSLAFEGRSTRADLAVRASAMFTRPPRYPFYTRSRLYAMTTTTLHAAVMPDRNETPAEWYATRRRLRARGPIVPMPDLTRGVQEYETRVRSLAAHCQSAGKRCVFLTQPTMWRGDLTPAEEGLLLYGWTGTMEDPKGFVAASDLARGMSQFNEALLAVCKSNSLDCYDLASVIPKDTTALYDDCHFNERGARLVAQFIADHLLKGGPSED